MAASLLFGSQLAACRSTAPAEGAVQHVVLCWLKHPGDPADRRRLVEASHGFLAIPGVLAVRAGEPLPSQRSEVNDSFDVAVILTVRDAAALEAYLDHPMHRRAVEETLRPLVERIRVYDFLER